jgi:hypothetical protein
LAHLPEEDSSKADCGRLGTSRISKAMRPIPPSRPLPPDQPRQRSASSTAGQARHVVGTSAWNRYMPRFLATSRRRRAVSHSAGKEADARNSAARAGATTYADAVAATEPEA